LELEQAARVQIHMGQIFATVKRVVIGMVPLAQQQEFHLILHVLRATNAYSIRVLVVLMEFVLASQLILTGRGHNAVNYLIL
jgi:hypothetical protein